MEKKCLFSIVDNKNRDLTGAFFDVLIFLLCLLYLESPLVHSPACVFSLKKKKTDMSTKETLQCPLLVLQQQGDVFARQRWPAVTGSGECLVTVFKCEHEEPSSTITSVSWKAPESVPPTYTGQNSAEVFDRRSGYLTFSLAFLSFPSLPFFPLFLLRLRHCVATARSASRVLSRS